MEKISEKNEKAVQPSVSLDGSKLRQAREGKKLTQLYVASVVGVTTDTISRWENNRYPSVKRDNALKLCVALEVELAEILRQDEAEPSVETEPPPPLPPSSRSFILYGLGALLLVACLSFVLVRFLLVTPSAVRWTPRYAAPGSVIPVQIKIDRRGSELKGFLIKENLPRGCKLIGALPPTASVESQGDEIKWLIPRGSGAVTVSYTARLPAGAPQGSEAVITGDLVVYAEGTSKTEHIAGDSRLKIGAYHWADLTGDGRIDDDEIMPAYYVCEAMKGLGLDWKTIEAVWSAKRYRWDPEHGYTVVK